MEMRCLALLNASSCAWGILLGELGERPNNGAKTGALG